MQRLQQLIQRLEEKEAAIQKKLKSSRKGWRINIWPAIAATAVMIALAASKYILKLF